MTSLSPVPVEPLFGRPRDLCPEVTFFYVHIHERFRSNRTSGKWSKKADRRTSGRTDICTSISAEPLAADKKKRFRKSVLGPEFTANLPQLWTFLSITSKRSRNMDLLAKIQLGGPEKCGPF